MKAGLVYILLLCFCLPGGNHNAFATTHSGKLNISEAYNSFKQQPEINNFIDVEDESDDKDVTRKFTHVAKWLTDITSSFISVHLLARTASYIVQSNNLNRYITDICIEQSVLRI